MSIKTLSDLNKDRLDLINKINSMYDSIEKDLLKNVDLYELNLKIIKKTISNMKRG